MLLIVNIVFVLLMMFFIVDKEIFLKFVMKDDEFWFCDFLSIFSLCFKSFLFLIEIFLVFICF